MNVLRRLLAKLLYIPLALDNRLFLNEYKQEIPLLVKRVRSKEKIRVLFVLSQLPKWKTEALYRAMLSHPRFDPILGVALGIVDYPTMEAKKLYTLLDYINQKGYKYTELRLTADIKERILPDIIFYQEATGGINNSISFQSFHGVLFCYSCYGIQTTTDKALYNSPYQNICWKYFADSPLNIEFAKGVMSNYADNLIYTGAPFVDELLADKVLVNDPWKQQSLPKKRIIWAPHHTIGIGKEEISYGCFLAIAEGMKALAEKYSDEVQWAFKPHPSLKQKLYYLWGEERTNAYWAFWSDSENCQLEEGKYIALFQYSDAIVHDSASFTVEYLYMKKPCMFLDNGKPHSLNEFGTLCEKQYYKGSAVEDIEHFVLNVINDVDPRKEERDKFFNDYLLPPNGKTACQNIIDSILGQ